MKNKILFFSFLSILLSLFFLGNATGPGFNGNGNRTGSPGADGTCSSCHSGGTFGTVTSIDIKNSAGTSVTSVMGDSVYTVIVSGSPSSGTPSAYGFQAIAVDDSTTNSAGTFSDPGTGIRFTNITTNKTVAEHLNPSALNSFTFKWKAPSYAGGNSATIYAYVNAVNLNGQTSGDAPAGDSYTVTVIPSSNPSAVSMIYDPNELALELFPNPVVNRLQIRLESNQNQDWNIRIFNQSGQEMLQKQVSIPSGKQQVELAVSDLPVGIYRLQLQSADGRFSAKSFVKY